MKQSTLNIKLRIEAARSSLKYLEKQRRSITSDIKAWEKIIKNYTELVEIEKRK